MRLSISNIAWQRESDEKVASILNLCGIDLIDIAPGKYFNTITDTPDREIVAVKNWWGERGIGIAGMQSLLYGTQGLNLFIPETQNAILNHMQKICHIGAIIGGKKLVFGAPKNRDKSGLDDLEAEAIAIDFFYRLGEIAKQEGAVICLEPIPPMYGANFLCTTSYLTNK